MQLIVHKYVEYPRLFRYRVSEVGGFMKNSLISWLFIFGFVGLFSGGAIFCASFSDEESDEELEIIEIPLGIEFFNYSKLEDLEIEQLKFLKLKQFLSKSMIKSFFDVFNIFGSPCIGSFSNIMRILEQYQDAKIKKMIPRFLREEFDELYCLYCSQSGEKNELETAISAFFVMIFPKIEENLQFLEQGIQKARTSKLMDPFYAGIE